MEGGEAGVERAYASPLLISAGACGTERHYEERCPHVRFLL
jgi:hypothetical protein